MIWLPCTSYFAASSASVLSPFSAAKATFALNAAVWFVSAFSLHCSFAGDILADESRSFT